MTSLKLSVLDACSEPGVPGGVNEDAWGANGRCAFVIDGATGLGDEPVIARQGTDAQWLAQLAATEFRAGVEDDVPVGAVVRRINTRTAEAIAARGHAVPAWNLPVAGFQMIRVENGSITTWGLGDCRLFLAGADRRVTTATAHEEASAREREAARRAVAHAGGLAEIRSLARHPDIREKLREARALYNRPGAGIWTLGTAPAAADHVAMEMLTPTLPAAGLLCSDGFAALVDQYGAYDMRGLVEAAQRTGLAALLAELRDIERVRDPNGLRFPRFKASDDATAVLFAIEATAE